MPTLEFKGKQHIYAHHLTVPYRPLIPDESKSVNPSTDEDDNLIIHGDNLHALKALLPRYAGRVKCIYIDPPYNTGNEGWVYNDKVNSPLMKEWLEKNGPVDDEDLERHDKWLAMMWPRLHLLRDLLSEDGVIFVSIDDNEQHHLRMMMDEVFGQDHFVATFMWHSTKSNTNPALVSNSHTYNIVYARDLGVLKRERKAFKFPAIVTGFENPDEDSRGPWKADPFEAGGTRPNQMYEITNPLTGETFYPSQGNCWKNDYTRFQDLVRDNRIVFGKTGRGRPQRKRFLSEASNRGLTPHTWWDDAGTTTSATTSLKAILADSKFSNPKPVELLHRIIKLATHEDSIILDSFAGSGTTAHAVLSLNKEDGGNRKFILVECEEYADTITAERVRSVIRGLPTAKDKSSKEGVGGSFTYATLGDPIDVETLLTGEDLPTYVTLASWLLNTATGKSLASTGLQGDAETGAVPFYSTDSTNYHLFYRPNIDWLRGNDGILNEDKAQRISAVAKETGRDAIVFGPGKYIGQRELTDMGIIFCQLPYELHTRASAVAP